MARARPVILYLKKNVPSENAAIRLFMAVPKGERTKFMRQVMVLGRDAEARAQAARQAAPTPPASPGDPAHMEDSHDG
jgi:hypothetical protein